MTPSYALLATDLDGTLLNSSAAVSTFNRQAILLARQRGITVIAATARSTSSAAQISESSGLGPIAICANGAIGYNVETKELIWHHIMDGSKVSLIISELRRRAPGILFAAERHNEFISEQSFLRNLVVLANVSEVDDLTDYLSEPVTKVICRHSELEQQVLIDLINEIAGEEIAISPGSIDWVEILAPGTNKASGLEKACDYLEIDTSQTAAVGDHLNDVEMLRWVKWSAAVKNAHPLAIEAADVVVSSNDNHGVAQFINHLLDS